MAPLNSSERFAVLSSSRSGDRSKRQGSDRTSEGRGQKRSVAELMKQGSEPSQVKGQNGGRARDDVFSEINELLNRNSVLQLADFDYGIRQHLHALLGSGGREKLHNALETINTATSKKSRHDVKNWAAYLRKLLTKFDADVKLDKALEKDREARAKAVAESATIAEQCMGRNMSSSVEPPAKEGNSSKETTPKDLSDEEEQDAWIEALDRNLPEEDNWLKEIATTSVHSRQRAPSPPKEAPPPPPKELAHLCQRQIHHSLQEAPEKVLSMKPPMQPPSCPPEAYLKASLAQSLKQVELQRHQGKQMHTALDFPLEDWAAWLTAPPQHVVAN